MKKILLIIAFILVAAFIGCNQHKSPAAITGAGYSDPGPGHLAFEQTNLRLCKIAGFDGQVLINSKVEYDAFINDNYIYAGLTYTPAPYPVDYSKQSLIGIVYGYVNGNNVPSLEYKSVLSDGKTTTVNVQSTSRFCYNPNGPFYTETCMSAFAVTDKINTPLVIQYTSVILDCDGNTTTPPVWQPCATCTPGTYAGCVNGPVSFTAFTDGSGFPAPGFYSDTRENIAITTQAEYDAFIASHYMYYGVAGAPTPVPVDFSKKALIAVFMGQMPNTCFSTDVDSITGNCVLSFIVGAVPTQRLTVNIKETYPPMGAMCGQMITRPEKLVLVDRVNGAISFNYLP